MISIRGATTVNENNSKQILDRAEELLKEIINKNSIYKDDISSIFFSITKDITAVFPAKAARILGLNNVALLDFLSPDCDNSLPFCIRVLMQCNSKKNQSKASHIYLHNSKSLRPDLVHK